MKAFPTTLSNTRGALTLDPSRLLVAFRKAIVRAEAAAALSEVDLVLEDDEQPTDDAARDGDRKASARGARTRDMTPINHPTHRYWARTRRGGPIDAEHWDAIQKVLKARIDWLGPVYRAAGRSPNRGLKGLRQELVCPLPNALVIRPVDAHADKRNGKALNSTLAKYGLSEVPAKSRYLGASRYFIVDDPHKHSAYSIREQLAREKSIVAEARFENMPLVRPVAVEPNDTLIADQWNVARIGASGVGTTGWDLSTGVNTVVIAVIDSGCDLTHPDLQYSDPGIRLDTMGPDGAPTGNHGTACAGIAAATFDNAEGIAGVAGDCQILPLALVTWSWVELAAGINYAADNGAHVISMSLGAYINVGDEPDVDDAIAHAHAVGCVMCAATGNDDTNTVMYPARHPLVIGCGASDQIDERKNVGSPDGENWWGSNFGPEVSVVAPGVLIPTTDRQGASGYNSAAGTAGDYVMDFNGTSSATPHVSGLAALLRSLYPTLSNVEVRAIIERSAEKVGALAYASAAGYANGTWNQEMGYGRINVLRALDCADVMIRDWSGDGGVEPSSPPNGNFWSYSDIVVRIQDDDVFVPSDPSKSSNVERGQTNYLYVQMTNNGARDARNVVIDARITPYVGLQFVYPQDWSLVDAMHVAPTAITASFSSIPAGGSVIAKFSISSAQVEDLWGWIANNNWHPCLLASVNADNDYGFQTADLVGGSLVVRRNNLAQRNLSVIDVLANSSAAWPMVAGSRFTDERFIELLIDRSRVGRAKRVLLSLDETGAAFPRVDFDAARLPVQDDGAAVGAGCAPTQGGLKFLEATKVETTLGGCRGILTLAAGSRFDCGCAPRRVGEVKVKGGDIVLRDGRRFVDLREREVIVRFERAAGQLVPLALQVEMPEKVGEPEDVAIHVAQRDEQRRIVGGASVLYRVHAKLPIGRALAATDAFDRVLRPQLAFGEPSRLAPISPMTADAAPPLPSGRKLRPHSKSSTR